MFDDVECADHVERYAKSRLLKISSHQSARSSRAGKCQAFCAQGHSHHYSARTRLLQCAQDVARPTSYFQHSVAIGQISCDLFCKSRNHSIPCAKPEMPA